MVDGASQLQKNSCREEEITEIVGGKKFFLYLCFSN